MNHYSHFRAEDFVWDEAFRQWILAPTRENYRMWSNWLEENPDMAYPVKLGARNSAGFALSGTDAHRPPNQTVRQRNPGKNLLNNTTKTSFNPKIPEPM